MADLYSRLVGGAGPTTDDPGSWLDLLDEDESYRLSPRLQRDQDYWRGRLVDRPDVTTLSGRPPAWAARVVQSAGYIPRPVVNQLEQLAAANGASLAAAIVAAAAIYLYRITGERDQILGMPVSARTSATLRRVVGPAMNVVPLRIAVDPAESTADVVRQAGRRMREAMRHQRYWAGARRKDLRLAPHQRDIYGTALNFIPFDEDFAFAGRPIRKHILRNWPVEDLLILVQAGNRSAGIRADFVANAAHYDARALDQHRQSFSQLLEGAVSDSSPGDWPARHFGS